MASLSCPLLFVAAFLNRSFQPGRVRQQSTGRDRKGSHPDCPVPCLMPNKQRRASLLTDAGVSKAAAHHSTRSVRCLWLPHRLLGTKQRARVWTGNDDRGLWGKAGRAQLRTEEESDIPLSTRDGAMQDAHAIPFRPYHRRELLCHASHDWGWSFPNAHPSSSKMTH